MYIYIYVIGIYVIDMYVCIYIYASPPQTYFFMTFMLVFMLVLVCQRQGHADRQRNCRQEEILYFDCVSEADTCKQFRSYLSTCGK